MTFEVTLSDWQERAAALSLMLFVVLIAAVSAVLFATSWSAHHARVAALTDERAKYQGLLRHAPVWANEIEKLRFSPVERAAFIPSASAPQMQAKLSAIVTGDGATLRHVSVELKTESDEAPVELRATALFSANIAQLTRVLYDLRQARPYLFVTKLAVHGSAPKPGVPNRLQIDLVAVAYVRAP